MWQVVALVRNDVRLHGRTASLTIVGMALFLAFLDRTGQSGSSLTGSIVMLNIMLMYALGAWLVTQEKTAGTLAWIRTLPVSDHVIVTAKWISLFESYRVSRRPNSLNQATAACS